MRRTWLLLVLACSALLPAAPSNASSTPFLSISGRAGQAATLSVPAAGLPLSYREAVQRLPGPDGAVTGVLIRQSGSSKVVSAAVYANIPGFSAAVLTTVIGGPEPRLAPGSYSVMLLGDGYALPRIVLPRSKESRRLTSAGAIHRVVHLALHQGGQAGVWADPVQVPAGRTLLVAAAGTYGVGQQASTAAVCLERGVTAGGCASPDAIGTGAAPASGRSESWTAAAYDSAQVGHGAFTFSGRVVGAGVASRSVWALLKIAAA